MQYYIDLVYSISVFIIGLMFGSFFTLAIYRIPRHEDITHTRSYCPNCKHKLGFFDCFPILSYVSTIGRCRYCKKPISIRYPLIEFATGLTFLITYLIFGFTWQTLVLIICFIYLFLVIGVDIMKKKMTEEEIKEAEKKNLENKNKKIGAINIDIVIAIIAFGIFFASTIFIRRNYSTILSEYVIKSNALNLCSNKLNEAKADSINTLSSNSGSTEISSINYNYEIEVLPYIKNGDEALDNARVIISRVTYMLGSEEESITLKAIKVENSENE